MAYVIYHKETTCFLNTFSSGRKQSWAREQDAKAEITRQIKSGKIKEDDYLIAEAAEFKTNIEKKKIVQSLMTGTSVELTVNTPACCDPSTETYWSL